MTKNSLLFTVLFTFISSLNATEQVPFSAQIFTWEYTVIPQNHHDLTDWNNANNSLMTHIQKTTRGSGNNFYENILTFIKEMQEALSQNLNLVSLISTSDENLADIMQEVADEAFNEESSSSEPATGNVTHNDTSAAQDSATETASAEVVLSENDVQVTPAITISLSILATDAHEQETWIIAKEMLEKLSAQAATGKLSPEDFVQQLSAIFEFINKSSIHGSLQISSSAE